MCCDNPRRLQEATNQLNRYAFRHAVPILLAPPEAGENDLRNASGFFVRLPAGLYLGTAWHVVQHWIERRAEGVPLLFQVSDDVVLDPEACMAWRDEEHDIVFMHITEEQIARTNTSVCEPLPSWPPDHPTADSDLFVSGFPAQLRLRDGLREVHFRSFCAHLVVQQVDGRSAACALEQDYLTDIDGNMTPVGELDLGGMSGGPAFLVGNIAYPLVALVSEFALGVIRLQTLSHVDGLGQVARGTRPVP